MYCVSITMTVDLQEFKNGEWKWKRQSWQSYTERGGYLITNNIVYIIDIILKKFKKNLKSITLHSRFNQKLIILPYTVNNMLQAGSIHHYMM